MPLGRFTSGALIMSFTMSQKDRIGRASFLNACSRLIISLSVEECDTQVCLQQTAAMGIKVFGPARAIYEPEVELLVLVSPAKSASQ